jgi:hypothetical protein
MISLVPNEGKHKIIQHMIPYLIFKVSLYFIVDV